MRNLAVGCLVGVVVMFVGFYPITTSHKESLDDLEIRLDSIEERIVGETMHTILTEPRNIFVMLEDHPEWELIDAVPYSRCYRHLIGTSTADYIVCMAI